MQKHMKPISDMRSIQYVMSKADLHQRLNSANEITLSVKGRKSGRDIPRPVWFVHENNIPYLMPNYGHKKYEAVRKTRKATSKSRRRT